MDAHGLVVALKELAVELGRTPTRDVFYQKIRNCEFHVQTHFGTYGALIEAAGLEPNRERRITNKIFERPIDKFLESYEPQGHREPQPLPRGVYISDIHFPFSNQKVLDKFYRHIEKEKPDYVVLVGDAWDMYSHSRFPRSHNVFTPREEQELSRKKNEELWKEVLKANPLAKCYQMLGNHDVRPLKKVLESYPAAEDWVERMIRELFSFPGVETIFDPRQELTLGNVLLHHGYRSKLGDHRDYLLQNVIVGHTHVAGVVYRHLRGETLWEMNCGLAGDPSSKGLSYTPQKITHWTPAFAATSEDGPRIILC